MHTFIENEAEAATLLARHNCAYLQQAITFIEGLPSAELYSQKPVAKNGETSSSLGAHMRHVIDHYLCLLDGLADGAVNYDARARNPQLETDTAFATETLQNIMGKLQALEFTQNTANAKALTQLNIYLRTCEAPNAPEMWIPSNIMRELAFCISHTVHHYGIMVLVAKSMNVATPEGFGFAPSTLHHLKGN